MWRQRQCRLAAHRATYVSTSCAPPRAGYTRDVVFLRAARVCHCVAHPQSLVYPHWLIHPHGAECARRSTRFARTQSVVYCALEAPAHPRFKLSVCSPAPIVTLTSMRLHGAGRMGPPWMLTLRLAIRLFATPVHADGVAAWRRVRPRMQQLATDSYNTPAPAHAQPDGKSAPSRSATPRRRGRLPPASATA